MTKKELIEKYMNAKGYKVIAGELSDSLEAFLPFLLMDLEYSTFCEDIGTDWRFELKQHAKAWGEAYNRYNAAFFNTLTEDEQESVCDFMTEFETYMHNDLVLLKLAVMETMPEGTPLQHKKVVSAAYLCFLLTVVARTCAKKIYKRPHLVESNGPARYAVYYDAELTPELDDIARQSAAFCSLYARRVGLGHIKKTPKMDTVTKMICQHITRWLDK